MASGEGWLTQRVGAGIFGKLKNRFAENGNAKTIE
jgi:hypothetical protein